MSKVGRSIVTNYKQGTLREFFKSHLYKTGCIFRKHEWCDKIYYLFDITAGDMDINYTTSPRIFLNNLKEFPIEFDFNVVFIEDNKKTFKKLKENINSYISKIDENYDREYFKENISIINKRCHKGLIPYIETKNKWKFGLLYFDPNGMGHEVNETWNTISNFSNKWNAIDIVMNISLNLIKRLYNNPNTEDLNCRDLSYYLNLINKKKIFVRRDYDFDKWKFIMVFMTNMDKFQIYDEENFIDLDSYEGSVLLKKCDSFIRGE